ERSGAQDSRWPPNVHCAILEKSSRHSGSGIGAVTKCEYPEAASGDVRHATTGGLRLPLPSVWLTAYAREEFHAARRLRLHREVRHSRLATRLATRLAIPWRQ